MSESQSFDPEEIFQRLGWRNVRLGPGVVGKTSRAMLLLIALWAVIVWRIGPNPWIDALLVLIGLAATGCFIWWTRTTQNFAERNPAQAMLEGAQLLEYQRFEATIKGQLPGADGSQKLGPLA